MRCLRKSTVEIHRVVSAAVVVLGGYPRIREHHGSQDSEFELMASGPFLENLAN